MLMKFHFILANQRRNPIRGLGPDGFRGNIHYRLRSSLNMKAGPKGEAGGRRRRTVEVLAGPEPWNKQRMGLAGLAIEAKTHRLRLEALPGGPLSEESSSSQLTETL
jgi:hypothetical protein